MKRQITTHVLDTSRGKPAAGIACRLDYCASDGKWIEITSASTNSDGRIEELCPVPVQSGCYRLTLDTKRYFEADDRTCFYPWVAIHFEINNTDQHTHVPLLLSPFGYSTYRGS